MLVIQPSSIWSHCSAPSCSGRSPVKWCPLPAVNVTHPTPALKNWIPLVTMETKSRHLIFFYICAQQNPTNSNASLLRFRHKYKMPLLYIKRCFCVTNVVPDWSRSKSWNHGIASLSLQTTFYILKHAKHLKYFTHISKRMCGNWINQIPKWSLPTMSSDHPV